MPEACETYRNAAPGRHNAKTIENAQSSFPARRKAQKMHRKRYPGKVPQQKTHAKMLKKCQPGAPRMQVMHRSCTWGWWYCYAALLQKIFAMSGCGAWLPILWGSHSSNKSLFMYLKMLFSNVVLFLHVLEHALLKFGVGSATQLLIFQWHQPLLGNVAPLRLVRHELERAKHNAKHFTPLLGNQNFHHESVIQMSTKYYHWVWGHFADTVKQFFDTPLFIL